MPWRPIPPIPGARESKRVLTSTELQKITPRPKRLGIIGGGPIGVEFAGIFSSYGTEVTLLEGAPALFGRYDDDSPRRHARLSPTKVLPLTRAFA